MTLLIACVGGGCATGSPPKASSMRCAGGTHEVVERRDPDLVDHRCEDDEGRVHGVAWTTEGGELRSTSSYRAGALHGPTWVWSETGHLWAELEYRAGDPLRRRFWHENGRLHEEWVFENPQKARVEKWDENGKLTDRLWWQNGDINGTWTKYWADGKLRRRAEWQSGKPSGRFEEWYENGSPRALGVFEAGRKVGDWRYWSEDGSVIPAPSAN